MTKPVQVYDGTGINRGNGNQVLVTLQEGMREMPEGLIFDFDLKTLQDRAKQASQRNDYTGAEYEDFVIKETIPFISRNGVEYTAHDAWAFRIFQDESGEATLIIIKCDRLEAVPQEVLTQEQADALWDDEIEQANQQNQQEAQDNENDERVLPEDEENTDYRWDDDR